MNALDDLALRAINTVNIARQRGLRPKIIYLSRADWLTLFESSAPIVMKPVPRSSQRNYGTPPERPEAMLAGGVPAVPSYARIDSKSRLITYNGTCLVLR